MVLGERHSSLARLQRLHDRFAFVRLGPERVARRRPAGDAAEPGLHAVHELRHPRPAA